MWTRAMNNIVVSLNRAEHYLRDHQRWIYTCDVCTSHNVSNIRSIESNFRAPVQLGNNLTFGANGESRLAMVARAYHTVRQWNSTARFAIISYQNPSTIV